MQVQVNLGFDQLVEIVKALPATQLHKLKEIIDKGEGIAKPNDSLETILLNGPIATKKQLETIAKNRNDINQWLKISLEY